MQKIGIMVLVMVSVDDKEGSDSFYLRVRIAHVSALLGMLVYV